MESERKQEIHQMLEACQQTDNSDLEAEKTAIIQELLMEVERMENGEAGGWRAMARVLAEVEQAKQGNQPHAKN
jgi:hypothetical protein